jgi:hypothetical protein
VIVAGLHYPLTLITKIRRSFSVHAFIAVIPQSLDLNIVLNAEAGYKGIY